MRTAWVVILLTAGLAGCAKPALYQPMRGEDVGYGEQQLEKNRYRVWFAGNSATPRETVEDYVLYRCAELTLEHGYDYFVLSDRTAEREQAGGGSGISLGIGGFRFGGRGGVSVGVGTGIPLGGDAKYFGQADAVFMKGKKPANDASAFDAREIKANLEPGIIRNRPS
jgi:hypothetical protein